MLIALLLVGGLAWIVSTGGPEDAPTPAAAGADGSATASDRSSPSQASESTQPSETADPTPTRTPRPRSTPAGGPAAEQQFVEGYYGTLPGDTRSGYEMLSPSYQAETGGYSGYAGFWNTIEDVQVTSTTPAGDGVVDVGLTYVTSSGTDSEVRRIYLEPSGGEYLITGSEIVG